MTTWLAYGLGVATVPAISALVLAVAWVRFLFTDHSEGYGCYACRKRWGLQGDGSSIAVARARKWWHRTTAHPGEQGRIIVATWRGWPASSWEKYERLMRAYPTPPVTVLDIAARTPLVSRLIAKAADRHGRKNR